MTTPTHEHTINVALGEMLGRLRQSWTTRSEQTGQVLIGGGRPDILIEEASGWPVVIEAERTNRNSAENEAKDRLGRTVARSGRQIETAIALVYPEDLHSLDGAALRNAIQTTSALNFALYTRRIDQEPERLPTHGWLSGSLLDLAMLVRRAAVPPPRVETLATELENGVRFAANEFTRLHVYGGELGAQVASVLGQSDDEEGQTRRMAMTVIANALVFHESLAGVEFQVPQTPGGHVRRVQPVRSFRAAGTFASDEMCFEWERILSVNYWPIFWSAKEMLGLMPTATTHAVLELLWPTVRNLVSGGVTQSHDLTGILFQRLIADRKFLATYYTRPEAAALLAGLAMPADKPLGGAVWEDGETLASIQIGDFACGTGTLLSTAYQRMSLLHELNGGDPRKLHGPMMRHGLVGLDVLNIAVHLTAAMLAGSQPDTPFDGECLLTMPFGQQDNDQVAIGSLDLLAETVQQTLMDTAAAVSAGGRAPELVRDLVSRVGHGRFDLVMMNPPFVRSTGMEGEKRGKGNPAFAAFETDKPIQDQMQDSLRKVRGTQPLGTGNTGLAADFLDLALRKVRADGTIALVLPLSAVSGKDWERARATLRADCQDIVVVTIAGPGSYDSSFSADTGMAECLLVARKVSKQAEKRATFVMLNQLPRSAVEAELVANQIARVLKSRELRGVESTAGRTDVTVGDQYFGGVLSAPIPESGPWQLVGISDVELAQFAWNLERGRLVPLGLPNAEMVAIPLKPIGGIAGRGPYHADIYWNNPNGTIRGPFELIRPPVSPVPTYPMLWGHDATRERKLVVEYDCEGKIKAASGRLTQTDVNEKAARVWSTASHLHYNRDLQFNSQSLVVATTTVPCVGGRAWPSVVFDKREHGYVFALWCNSSLGLAMHWWMANKTQAGRGTTTVTSIPGIPTLDVGALTDEQITAAKCVFDELVDQNFLPFDQIDEDSARAELDRRLITEVLGLPEMLVEPGGPIELLRRKLASEPQIHGGKGQRVVFHEAVADDGSITVIETTEDRTDR